MGWLSSQSALFTGILLALLLLTAIAWMSWRGQQLVVEQDMQQEELFARIFEDQASRTFDSVAVVVASLSESFAAQETLQEQASMTRQMAQALTGVPFVRSIALVDQRGLVMASSNGNDVGVEIDLQRLGPRPPKGQALLGSLQRGRGLADLERGQGGQNLRPGVNLIPMQYTFVLRNGQTAFAVALINPDALVNFQNQAIADNGLSVTLARYSGELLTSSVDMLNAPGRSIAAHSLFRDRRVALEHGAYLDHPPGAEEMLVAYRSSRSWPFVVIVERPQSLSTKRWFDRARPVLASALVIVLLLLGMALVLYRSLAVRERTRLMVDRARDQVVRSERELSVLLRSLQELIFRTDAAGAVTYINGRWSVVLGVGAEQIIGRGVLDVLVPERAADRSALFAVESPDGVRHCRASAQGADGRVRYFEVAVVPLLVEGQVTAFAGSAVDVTELLDTQGQLQMQLSLIGLMLEISPQPVSMSDDRGRLVMVNKAWEHFKGLERSEVIGKRLPEFLPEAEAVLHERAERQLAREGGEMRFEARITRHDRSLRDVLIGKVMVPSESGSLIGVLSVMTDVTEFREAERAIREARDVAEEASRSKSEFVANISHELRTPLQSIIGFSELGMVRGGGNERITGMFQDINASGQRMLSLVNDLLDVSKIESTVGTFHLESVDLRGQIRTVAREMAPLLARKHLTLALELPGVPLVAKADPMRFQQVIRNVMANAVKFSPPDQAIELEADMRPEGEIHIAVRDHGPGIPEAEIEKIFEAFVQSSKTKDGAGGTGLGLAIARELVQMMGGEVVLESRPGRTVVRVVLGAAPTSVAAEPAASVFT